MAKKKTGFIYYNTDTDRYQDIKIKRLKKSFGCIGLAVYDYILCEIYRDKGCFIEWDEHTAFDVSDYLGIKESVLEEVVTYCCTVGLFDKELLTREMVLSSKSIQLRFVDMCKRAKRKDAEIPEQLNIIREESPKLPEVSSKPPEVSDNSRVKESKEENSKVEESKREESFDLVDDGIYDYWKFYLDTTQTQYSLSAHQKLFTNAINNYGWEIVKKVIQLKTFQSTKNQFERKWLRPQTIFRQEKIENYVNEVRDIQAGRTNPHATTGKRNQKADNLKQASSELRRLKEMGV